MILAGDIGATRTRLAAFETEGNRLQCVVEKTYPSQEHASLSEILPQFIRTEGIPVHSACFGVAGPVRAGRSKISNLPWTIDSRELAKQLKLDSVGLLNDLEAYAYGIDALESKDFVTLSEGSEDAEGNRAVISAQNRARRGRPLLGRIPPSSFRLRGRARRLRPQKRSADRIAGISPEEIRPRQLRANSLRPRHQEHLRLSARHAESRGTGLAARSTGRRSRSSAADLATGAAKAKLRSASRPCQFSSASLEPRRETARCITCPREEFSSAASSPPKSCPR